MKKVRFIGLDVRADTIAIAVAEPGGEVRSVGVITEREKQEGSNPRCSSEVAHDYAVPTREYQSDQPSRWPPRPPSMLPSKLFED